MMSNLSLEMLIPDESKMLGLGANLAFAAEPRSDAPVVIYLSGPLGAGKTTLIRGFLRGLGYVRQVKSPSYTLVEPYEFEDFNVYHFDFYRLKDPAELEFMGIKDYFVPKTICLIEWPEAGNLPNADITCHIEMQWSNRLVKMIANTEYGKVILGRFQNEK